MRHDQDGAEQAPELEVTRLNDGEGSDAGEPVLLGESRLFVKEPAPELERCDGGASARLRAAAI